MTSRQNIIVESASGDDISNHQFGHQSVSTVVTKMHRAKKRPECPAGNGSWAAMKQRCSNPNNTGYKHYGARGIRFDPRWVDFATFIADMGPPPSASHTLDRIDSAGNYERSNCRWATKLEQACNRSTTTMVEYKGQSRAVPELAKEAGIAVTTFRARLIRGMNVNDAMNTPVKRGGNRRSGTPRGYTSNPHNCWPPSIDPRVVDSLERSYQNRSQTDAGMSRPAFFLFVTQGEFNTRREALEDCHVDEIDPELRSKVERLQHSRTEAERLMRALSDHKDRG